ncbi:uncharacterized protein F4822DRAFT_247525 [Hypoxylon trugodes]|uniref:uncharacterized protein n=1 Tax=Hypoxylon trugodes TaxID=326681 RepID=UPI00219FDB4C|nr:uncharacterized protein F4822DRAFT_247525 [Hypoxylon trugodes]KAI1388458.1 hypothetical protein F4822DRAFT_247525 [Hypoxylon trugodes]
MHDRATIQKHFSVKSDKQPDPFYSFAFFKMLSIGDMMHYVRWERCKNESHPLEDLMSWANFKQWLIAHFLKICLPFLRNEGGPMMVYAPLNMATFFRLLIHTAGLGYPGHWLSSIIMALSSGMISTTARAPRELVKNPKNVDVIHPAQTICIKPWIAEFTTLAAQWQDALPFAMAVPSGTLPSPEAITEYLVKIPCRWIFREPHLMLVFWNHKEYDEPPRNLYQVLLNVEVTNPVRHGRLGITGSRP